MTIRTIEIIRGSTHDGPGMRTTLFLKGCPLRCSWCQNPEGIDAKPDVWWEAHKCIGCIECLEACPNQALSQAENGLVIDREKCTRCGVCVEACPSRAMSFNSRDWSVEALTKEALKDKDYYAAFGGGVTVSGGEPLIQYRAVAELLRRLQEAGVHTALDTCGMVSKQALDAVLSHTDHVLFDIKLLDSVLHKQHTGQPNETILANLEAVATHIRQVNTSMKLWIRTPLIPGMTATPENIRAIGQLIHCTLSDVVQQWELCAFNNACQGKYERMGLPWMFGSIPLMTQSDIDAVRDVALSTGIHPEQFATSGLIVKG